jgi:predicted nucleic acid-binding protein
LIYVDTNVFIYAVGKAHPLRSDAQNFFIQSRTAGLSLVTSAGVLQEMLHVYLPVRRMETLDRAMDLVLQSMDEIFSIGAEDALHAHSLAEQHLALTARDLLHLAVCQTRKVKQLKSYDRSLTAAFK